jgi:hypothetical protein
MKNIALPGANLFLQEFIYTPLNNLFINSKLTLINNSVSNTQAQMNQALNLRDNAVWRILLMIFFYYTIFVPQRLI